MIKKTKLDKVQVNEKNRYNGLDGLRTIACIGIILMHMASKDNNNYVLSDPATRIIGSFTNFVFLFMAISAFGLCCGYYEKFLDGTVDLIQFYKKRYIKILPFFTFVVLIDVVMEFSKNTFIEAIADVSLTFGLFQNDITVIGVAWFLGLIFAFYMIFPFYCVLMHSKKTAWMTFISSLILNGITGSYFGMDRRNIVFSFCFFVCGGLIYLYRENLENLKVYITIPLVCIAVVIYYYIGANVFNLLFVTAALMIIAITDAGGKILHNKITAFISGISLEIYLCHMVIFRGLEKLSLNTRFGTGLLQYVITVLLVIGLSIIFVLIVKKIGEKAKWVVTWKRS